MTCMTGRHPTMSIRCALKCISIAILVKNEMVRITFHVVSNELISSINVSEIIIFGYLLVTDALIRNSFKTHGRKNLILLGPVPT